MRISEDSADHVFSCHLSENLSGEITDTFRVFSLCIPFYGMFKILLLRYVILCYVWLGYFLFFLFIEFFFFTAHLFFNTPHIQIISEVKPDTGIVCVKSYRAHPYPYPAPPLFYV